MSNEYELTIEYIDTCLPCYLADHHNREGEYLIAIACSEEGLSKAELLEDLLSEFNSEDCPEAITDSQIQHAAEECLAQCEDSGAAQITSFDPGPEGADFEGDIPYAYFVARWTESKSE